MRKKKNIILEEVLVENYAAEGKSLARQQGKVIFIENVVPGDVVDVRLSKNKKDWAEGYPVHFKSYSKERVEPFCRHFGVCGGCQWQMLPYHKQLQYKQQQVIDNLTRIGKIKLPPSLPIAGAAEDKFYRNKLEYTFSTKEFTPNKPTAHPDLPGGKAILAQPLLNQDVNSLSASSFSEVGVLFSPIGGDGGGCKVSEQVIPPLGPDNYQEKGPGALGFHAKGFFDKVVQIEKCWLQPEPNNAIRNAVYTFACKKKFSFYNQREHKGFLRNLQLRICSTGQVMVNVVFGENNEQKRNEILEFIKQKFPQVTTLVYTINLKWNDSLNDLEPVAYFGKGYVIEKLENFQFKIGPKSFFQTNTQQAEKLYQITREFAELNGSQILYDLYCGTGSIGIFCSKEAKKNNRSRVHCRSHQRCQRKCFAE